MLRQERQRENAWAVAAGDQATAGDLALRGGLRIPHDDESAAQALSQIVRCEPLLVDLPAGPGITVTPYAALGGGR